MKYYRIICKASKEFEEVMEAAKNTHEAIKDHGCWLDVFSRMDLRSKTISDRFLWYPSWTKPAIYDVRMENGEWILDTGTTLAPDTLTYRGNAEFYGTFCDEVVSVSQTEAFIHKLHGETACGETISEEVGWSFVQGEKGELNIEGGGMLSLRRITDPVKLHISLSPEEGCRREMYERLKKTSAYYRKWKTEEEYLPMLLMDWLRALATPAEVFKEEVHNPYLSELMNEESEVCFTEFIPLYDSQFRNTAMGAFLHMEGWDGNDIHISCLSLTEPIFDHVLDRIKCNGHTISWNKEL